MYQNHLINVSHQKNCDKILEDPSRRVKTRLMPLTLKFSFGAVDVLTTLVCFATLVKLTYLYYSGYCTKRNLLKGDVYLLRDFF